MQAHNGSLFPASIVTLYCTYLAYSALASEPHDYMCNGLGHRLNAASASTLAAGMLLTLLSVVYSALRAGSNTALLSFGEAGGSQHGEALEPLVDAEAEGATEIGEGQPPEVAPAGRNAQREGISFVLIRWLNFFGIEELFCEAEAWVL